MLHFILSITRLNGFFKTVNESSFLLRDDIRTKKTFQFGHCPNLGGGLPLPELFCALFLLKEKVSPWSRRRKESVKLPELGGGVWLIRAMPELKRFFCSDVVPYTYEVHAEKPFECMKRAAGSKISRTT